MAEAIAILYTVMVNMVNPATGQVIASIPANARTFSTGSRGYGANGKIEINGKRYQCSLNLVEIGSKNAPENLPAPVTAVDSAAVLAESDSAKDKKIADMAALAAGGSSKPVANQTVDPSRAPTGTNGASIGNAVKAGKGNGRK